MVMTYSLMTKYFFSFDDDTLNSVFKTLFHLPNNKKENYHKNTIKINGIAIIII